jgi:rfaE bifunctional protein kinase chain/domain
MTEKEVRKSFEKFNNLNVLIIGDVMVDAYLFGTVDRISPEAPVPVVSVTGRMSRMGGAANVALNVKSLGGNPILCSVVGKDMRGKEFVELMKKEDMITDGIQVSNHRPTTTKFRIVGNNVQMLRVDEESTYPISSYEERPLIRKIRKIIEENTIDVIIMEDYDKGCITENIIEFVQDVSEKYNIPVTVDPKRRNFDFYRDLTVLKPNFKELIEGVGLHIENGDIQAIKFAMMELMKKNNIEIGIVTLSEHGILVCERNTQMHIPAIVRNIADVSGAGDTVISTLSLAMASGLSAQASAMLANLAGGLVCEQVGVVPVNRDQLFKEAVKVLKKAK